MKRKTVKYHPCLCGKRGFDTEREADRALGRSRRRRESLGTLKGQHVEHRVYQCAFSPYYHLTSKSKHRRFGMPARTELVLLLRSPDVLEACNQGVAA